MPFSLRSKLHLQVCEQKRSCEICYAVAVAAADMAKLSTHGKAQHTLVRVTELASSCINEVQQAIERLPIPA